MPSYSKQIFNLLEYKSRVTPKLFIIKCPPYVHSSFGNNLMIKSLIKRSFFDVNFLLFLLFGEHRPNRLAYSCGLFIFK